MTAKEKAKELFDRFSLGYYHSENAKRCSLIALDEMLGMLPFPEDEWHLERESFLSEVKNEIENL